MINRERKQSDSLLVMTILLVIIIIIIKICFSLLDKSNPNKEEHIKEVTQIEESENSTYINTEIIDNYERIGFVLSEIDLSQYEGSDCTEGIDELQQGISPLVEQKESKGLVTLQL